MLPVMTMAQNNKNWLSVDVQNSLQFVLNDNWDIEQSKTVTNALKISIKTQSKNCYVYGKLHSISGNTSTPLSPGYFKIKYRSTTAGNGQIQYLNTQDVTLNYSDQLLFRHGKRAHLGLGRDARADTLKEFARAQLTRGPVDFAEGRARFEPQSDVFSDREVGKERGLLINACDAEPVRGGG